MPAPYTANQIADFVLAGVDREAGDSITHLKLQKLIYYCQAWSLALTGEPLFDEDLKAWAHGPVAESVFHRFREYGYQAIPAPEHASNVAPEHADHISEILEIYGDYSAKHLERMSHAEDPWRKARGATAPEARSNAVIAKETMASFYSSLYEQANGEE